MAKNRFINTKFWSDGFIIELNPLDRYLFLYFLTNEHTNICGIYELPLKRMADETGIEKEMLSKMLKRLKGKIEYVNGWVYIKNFTKHQSPSEKIHIGIENGKKLVPEDILKKIYLMDKVSIPTQLPEPEPEPESELESESKHKAEFESEGSGASPLIPKVIKLFERVNPACKSMYGNKTQRRASQDLLDTYGFEELGKVIAILPKTNKLTYFPSITTPAQLWNDYQKLKDKLIQEKTKPDKNKPNYIL